MVDDGLRRRDFGIAANLLSVLVPRWRREFLGVPHGLDDWQRFVVAYPRFAELAHDWLAQDGLDDVWRSCVFHALLTTAFEFGLGQTVQRPAILDEGFAQRFFTLRGYRGIGQPGDAARYAERMPLPSALVFVSTPPETCAERVKRRPNLPLLMQGEAVAALPGRFGEGRALLSDLAAELERRGVPVLRVAGDGDPGATVRAIAEFSRAILFP